MIEGGVVYYKGKKYLHWHNLRLPVWSFHLLLQLYYLIKSVVLVFPIQLFKEIMTTKPFLISCKQSFSSIIFLMELDFVKKFFVTPLNKQLAKISDLVFEHAHYACVYVSIYI